MKFANTCIFAMVVQEVGYKYISLKYSQHLFLQIDYTFGRYIIDLSILSYKPLKNMSYSSPRNTKKNQRSHITEPYVGSARLLSRNNICAICGGHEELE